MLETLPQSGTGRRASTDLQDFVFDGRLPAKIEDTLEGDTLQLTDGTRASLAEIASYAAGAVLGCNHEFRDGSHDNYKVHLDHLRERSAVFNFLKDNFGVARPKNPFISIGKFTKLAARDKALDLAEPDHSGRHVCCDFWEVMSGYDDRKHKDKNRTYLKQFYAEWIGNVRCHLKSVNIYDHTSFLAGFMHNTMSQKDVPSLYFEAAIKAASMAQVIPAKGGLTAIRDGESEFVILFNAVDGQVTLPTLSGTSAVKIVIMDEKNAYVIPTGELRKLCRDKGTQSPSVLDIAEHSYAEVFPIPECLK